MIASEIKRRRRKLRLKQWELAQISGVSRATLSRLECGEEIDIRLSTLKALAKALNCAPSKLL